MGDLDHPCTVECDLPQAFIASATVSLALSAAPTSHGGNHIRLSNVRSGNRGANSATATDSDGVLFTNRPAFYYRDVLALFSQQPSGHGTQNSPSNVSGDLMPGVDSPRRTGFSFPTWITA